MPIQDPRIPPHSVNDLLIIGAGPTGLFAAFYAGMRQMTTCILDSLHALGGQLVTLYPEKYIYDVPGYPKVLARDLAAKLIEQALQYHPAVSLGQQVKHLNFDESTRIYSIHTNQGIHQARAILIAAGVGAFAPKRLPLVNASQFEGRGLHYSVGRVEEFRDKRILIIGGGDSAVDWANTLAAVARKITLIHRRDEFRAHEDSVARMKQSGITIHTFHELKTIVGDQVVQQAVVFDNRTNDEKEIEIDAVLVNVGFVNALGPIKDWGLDIEGSQIRVDSMMRTNRPGIFAAGDIVTYPGKLKLIATGFGEAAVAVNFAKHYLDPQAHVFPGHSSNLKR